MKTDSISACTKQNLQNNSPAEQITYHADKADTDMKKMTSLYGVKLRCTDI